MRALLAAGLALLGAVGCDPQPPVQATLDDYVIRVARVLERGVAEASLHAAAGPAYPRARQRRLPVPAVRTGLFEFLSLQQCDLGSLIGQRNSSLGRVMTSSQQLLYEHRFIIEAQRCVDTLRTRGEQDEVAASLERVLERKRAALGRVAWNTTFGGPVFAGLFPLDAQPLPVKKRQGPRSGRAALRALAETLQGVGEPGLVLAGWERPFERLSSSRFGGRLRASLAALTGHLDAVAVLIEARLAERPVCFREQPSRSGRVLKRVFRKYYARGVQPYLARVHRDGRAWLEALEAVREAVSVAPPQGFASWWSATLARDQPHSEWARFEEAIRVHTQAWQHLLASCGLGPRRPDRGARATPVRLVDEPLGRG